MKSLGIP